MIDARILLIEDNADNLELVRFLLEQGGCQVLTAMDGENGLKLAEENRPDLVLLDLTLPEMDGWEVVRRLKENPETSTIRVVALTAHTLPGDRKRALEAGCDGYLSKPLDVPNFLTQVQGFLTKRAAS